MNCLQDSAEYLRSLSDPRPEISVIINNYNYGRFLGQALESALAQVGPSFEVVVVDDGSHDESHAILERYRGRANVVLQKNRGQASAINAGVAASRGEILCFLDADDWFAPGKLGGVAAAFRSDPRAALAFHRLQPVDVNGRPKMRPIPRTLCAGDLAETLSRSAGWWPFPLTSAVAVRRSAWHLAGPIPESFRISADAWLVGVYPFIGKVVALRRALGFYRIHDNAWYRATDDAEMLRRRMAHWKATVEATNRFLTARGFQHRLSMADHFPYRLAAAHLDGVGLAGKLRLAARGLSFAGEPSLVRRMKNVLRAVPHLPTASARRGIAGSPE